MAHNHVAQLGELALLIALAAATYAVAAALLSVRRGIHFLDSAIHAVHATTALLSLASLVLLFSLSVDDYATRYVYLHSDAAMPLIYKLTSYWGGLDGSLLFWAWLLAVLSSLALYFYRQLHQLLLPWVIVTVMVVLLFFLALLVFDKPPFAQFSLEVPLRGRGLSPLLQNPYMAIHPPALYLGFVVATIPYGFAMAALITGEKSTTWLYSMRRWMLACWFFLSLGLVLGMLWAYEVLGWGGYWGWDPVENAGVFAWFTATAFLHSLKVQKHRGMMQGENVFLILITFTLTIVATFLTRSGFVESVHSFGSDPVLKITFLSLIVVVTVVSFGLLIYRRPLLKPLTQIESWLSRECVVLLGNRLLVGFALFLLLATIFPSLFELFGGARFNLTAAFYQRWAPVALVLVLLVGLAPLLAWRRTPPRRLLSRLVAPLLCATVITAILASMPALRIYNSLFFMGFNLPLALVDFAISAFAAAAMVQEFYYAPRKRRSGARLVHLGIVFMIVGFGGQAFKNETEVTLPAGQKATLGGYSFNFHNLELSEFPEKKVIFANLLISNNGHEIAHARPAKWYFAQHEEEPLSHIDITRGVLNDVYVVLNGFDAENNLAQFKIVIQPLVNWIWFGFVLLAFGGIMVFTSRRQDPSIFSSNLSTDISSKKLHNTPGIWIMVAGAFGLGAMVTGYLLMRGAQLGPSLLWLAGLPLVYGAIWHMAKSLILLGKSSRSDNLAA